MRMEVIGARTRAPRVARPAALIERTTDAGNTARPSRPADIPRSSTGYPTRRHSRIIDFDHCGKPLYRKALRAAALPGRPSVNPPHLMPDWWSSLPRRGPRLQRSKGQSNLRDGRQIPIVVRERDRWVHSHRLKPCCLSEAFRWLRRLCDASGPRQDAQRWAWATLVVHGTVPDHRAQCTWRHPDYCARYGPSLARLRGPIRISTVQSQCPANPRAWGRHTERGRNCAKRNALARPAGSPPSGR